MATCQNKDATGACADGMSNPMFCKLCNPALKPKTKTPDAVPVVPAKRGDAKQTARRIPSCLMTNYTARRDSRCPLTGEMIKTGETIAGISKLWSVNVKAGTFVPLDGKAHAMFVKAPMVAVMDKFAVIMSRILEDPQTYKVDPSNANVRHAQSLVNSLKMGWDTSGNFYEYRAEKHHVLVNVTPNEITVWGIGDEHHVVNFEHKAGVDFTGVIVVDGGVTLMMRTAYCGGTHDFKIEW